MSQLSKIQHSMMWAHLQELYDTRELLFTWARRDFRVRYSQSVLGAAWAILQPLSLMVIFSIIFSIFLKVPTDDTPYPIFVYVALLPWTFFSGALSLAIPSLVNNMNLVSKIYFPREILPLSSILVGLIDFLIACSIFVVMILVFGVRVGPAVLFTPLILAIQILLMFGISLGASAVNVFFRDIRFIIPLTLQLWMYISPVIYPVSVIHEWLRQFYLLNPMAVIIDSYRRAILHNQAPDWMWLGYATLVTLVVVLGAYRYFKQVEKEFADLI